MLQWDASKDHRYFKDMWEYHRPNGFRHTADIWDTRAEEWASQLESDTAFRRQMDERVVSTAKYLRERGLLGPKASVVDIGCGPGRFVAEFAKTAGEVLAIDISSRMLEYAAAYTQSLGLRNVSCLPCNFLEMDIHKQGWVGRFDLVFTSITPAIGDLAGLHKIMEMSRAYCFNSCAIHGNDELEMQVAKEVFDVEHRPRPVWDSRWFYSLFNLLWLEGYQPESRYHKLCQDEYVPADRELASYYARIYTDGGIPTSESVDRVQRYLEERSTAEGTIRQRTERWYGWLLWDVRERLPRMQDN